MTLDFMTVKDRRRHNKLKTKKIMIKGYRRKREVAVNLGGIKLKI